jgi:hypothetical protein
MQDDPKMSAPFPPFHSADLAPFIYFDLAVTYGTMAGAIQIELAARTLVPVEDGSTRPEFVITGRLRCSPAAISSLRDAIDRTLELLRQVQEQPGSADKAPAGRLN